MDLLVDLHLKFDPKFVTPEAQKEVWTRFIDECMNNLNSDNENLVINTL